MQCSRTSFPRFVPAALVAALLPAVEAAAAIHFQANVPDFYQHQKIWQGDLPIPYPAGPAVNNANWWEGYENAGPPLSGTYGGWCATTAWVNALYETEYTQGVNNLFSRGPGFNARPWLDQYVYNNEDLAIFSGGGNPRNAGCAFPDTMHNYLNSRGRTQHNVNVYEWNGGAGLGNRVRWTESYSAAGQANPNQPVPNPGGGNYDSMFDFYKDLIQQNNAVLLYVDRGTNTDPGVWWTNYHVVTGAGVETLGNDQIIWFADPNDTTRGIGDLVAGDIAYRYLAGDGFPDHDYNYTRYYIDPTDGRTFLQPGGTGLPNYNGIRISQIWTMNIPEPATGLLLACGAMALRKRRAATLNAATVVRSPTREARTEKTIGRATMRQNRLKALLCVACASTAALPQARAAFTLDSNTEDVCNGFSRTVNWTFQAPTDSADFGTRWRTVLIAGAGPVDGNKSLVLTIQHLEACHAGEQAGPNFSFDAGAFKRGVSRTAAEGKQEAHGPNHWDVVGYTASTRGDGLADVRIRMSGRHNPTGVFKPSFHNYDTRRVNLTVIPSYTQDGSTYERDDRDHAQQGEVRPSGDWEGTPLPPDADNPRPDGTPRPPTDYRIVASPKNNNLLGGPPPATSSTVLAFLGTVDDVPSELDLFGAADVFLGDQEFLAPNFVHDTLDVYVAIDLTQWVNNPTAFQGGDTFNFVNGVSDALPGILVGTSPVTLGPTGAWMTADPYTGALEVDGAIDGRTPEPATLVMLAAGVLLSAQRKRPPA